MRDAAADALRLLHLAQSQGGSAAVVVLTVVGSPLPRTTTETVSTEQVAQAFESLPLADPDAASLRAALSAAAGLAAYWQEPDGADVLVVDPAFDALLARVSTAIAGSPAAAWWTEPAPRGGQWSVGWPTSSGAAGDARAILDRWRAELVAEEARAARERPADPHANWSGTWWSFPPAALVRTTRGLGESGPGGLWFVEDGFGETESTATPVAPTLARVCEIGGADDWVELCRRHPLVVTASRRHDWFRTTGRDGGWLQPDWAAVAREYDAVHLTVAGYLAAAGRALPVTDGWASVIAGWAPDETFWFTPPVVEPARAEQWQRFDDGWRRV